MRNKSLIIVAAVAAVAAAAASVMVSSRAHRESAKPAGQDAAPLFPALRDNLNNVARIKVRRGTVESSLARTSDKPTWVVESRGNYPAEFDQVRRLIGGLAEATIVEAKTSKPDLYDRLGVGDFEKAGAAGTHVELLDASGKPIAALIIGNNSREGGENEPGGAKPRYFVRKDGDPQSYLAKGDLSVQADPLTWLNKSITEVDAAKVKSVTITQAGASQPIRVSKASAAEPKFTLENLPAGRQLKDEYKASSLGQALSGLTMEDVMPAAGMDFSNPEATVEARLFDGQIVTAKMITKDNKKWWAVEASYEEPPNTGAPATPEPPKAEAPAPEAPKPDTPASSDAPKPEADQAKEAAAKADAAKVDAAKAEAEKAQATEKAAAIKKVADINEKCGPWAYALPDYKVTQILVKLEDLLKPVEAPPPTAPPPQPMPNDGGLLQSPH